MMFHALMVCAWVVGNTVLALIPVLIARWTARGIQHDIDHAANVRWALWAPMLLLWLIFLPNGAYLLTEWRHYLSIVDTNPAFYSIYHDHRYSPVETAQLIGLTAFFGAYSVAGLVATGLAVWPLERLASRHFRTGPGLAALFVLNSLGVYMGLVDRLNSWELTPSTLAGVAASTLRVVTHPGLLLTVVLFGIFLRAVYAAFTVFARGLQVPTPRPQGS